ncbi:MAG: valine--tRNA ligase [Desulfobacteraceae bacterium]|nr:valine--tRNA ligase [Desulfobacteraceae bacterium]
MSDDLLEKSYDPVGIEEKWYKFWEENKYFHAKDKSDAKAYSIVIPPPNVTGVLHMGHALNITIQDIMCRYKRLIGDNVLWMPGTDHAGIATQNVVEKDLAKKGKSRDELGREEFIKEVWKWREVSGGAIINQLKRIGASCDWDRERFTMDKGLSKAVRKVFVKLYKDELIYKGQYIINWCPRCKTALSDLEVEYAEKDSILYYIKYPFENNDDDGLIVATTRPETMFGDTGVAINPEDKRYNNLSHNNVLLPLANRIIPIIKDKYVDVEFGTGALKITPAHDPNDFNLGEKHNLETVKVIDEDGNMTSGAGLYEGMDRFECRKKAVADLKNLGLLVKEEPLKNSIGECYRCKTIVEPFLSKQWFVKAKPLAEKAMEAVKQKKTRIIPSNWEKTYFEWLENIRDWCISRQIWWGHRIPVWKCADCGAYTVEEKDPDICCECGSNKIAQEEDVLDTWFSSALWPFSTMGWPENTELLKTFYSTNLLVTGFDILFFWVARMMMMGLYFMKDVPFKDVYIHALVRDEHGKKMSKSKGNVIDPIKVIDQYGADAFRFTLAAFAAQGRDVKMSADRVEGYRHFVNKLWNASRFALMHIDENSIKNDCLDNVSNLSNLEQWILSRSSLATQKVKYGIEEYRFNEAASDIYQFVWHEFCDWYLEAAKPALYEKEGKERRDAARAVLSKVLKDIIVMLHPFMPFVTEQVWSILPMTDGSIMKASFPYDADYYGKARNKEIETGMEFIFDLVTGIRNVRSEMNIPLSKILKVRIQTLDKKETEAIKGNKSIVMNLAKLDDLDFLGTENAPESSAAVVVGSSTSYVLLKDVIDVAKEEKRLKKEIEKVLKDLKVVSNRLNNDSFLDKAPENVINKVKDQYKELQEKNDKLDDNLDRIKGIK